MPHAKPRLSAYSRLLICQRVAAGRSIAHVPAKMGVSRQTVHRWVTRWEAEGPDGRMFRNAAARALTVAGLSG